MSENRSWLPPGVNTRHASAAVAIAGVYRGGVAARRAMRARAEIERFFETFGLLKPGAVQVTAWRPGLPDDCLADRGKFWRLVGVGRLR